jgi:uncharacterized protein (DUF2141 family)
MSGHRAETISTPPYRRKLRATDVSTIQSTLVRTLVWTLITGLIVADTAIAEDAKTCNLTIKILRLETDAGKLIVALLDDPEAFDANGDPVRDVRVDIENGEAVAHFGAIPYGTYAAKIFHDENSNDKLDTNFVGYPKEAFGFSMDAMGKFGPPSFEEAKFEVASPELELTVNMK